VGEHGIRILAIGGHLLGAAGLQPSLKARGRELGVELNG